MILSIVIIKWIKERNIQKLLSFEKDFLLPASDFYTYFLYWSESFSLEQYAIVLYVYSLQA